MTKGKKHSRPTLEEALAQPWCYYCEKVYTDLGALHSHQKDKHFQCPCRRRLNTAGGLKVHMAQVHKEELKEVPNALDHRKDPSIEVFIMLGIPEDILQQRRQEIETSFFRDEYDHRVRTGNPAPGTAQPGANKKAKTESSEDLKARVAQRRAENAARKAAEAKGSPLPSANSPLQASTPSTAAASPAPTPTLPGAPGINAFGTGAAPLASNGSNQFGFHAGAHPFNSPTLPPGLPSYPTNGIPLPMQPSLSPANAPFFAHTPPGFPRPPGAPSQSHMPGVNGLPAHLPPRLHNGVSPAHSLPQAPGHHPLSNSTSITQPSTNADHAVQPEDHQLSEASPPLDEMSLPKLLTRGLEIVKSNSKQEDGEGQKSPAVNLHTDSSDVVVSICNRIYGSSSVSSKAVARAEEILRGLLRTGADKTLPSDFTHAEKVTTLKNTTTEMAPPSIPESDGPKTKKKDPEKSKLPDTGLSWEEEHSLHRGTPHKQSTTAEATGPVDDSVTGVVGDGEMGNAVMEG